MKLLAIASCPVFELFKMKTYKLQEIDINWCFKLFDRVKNFGNIFNVVLPERFSTFKHVD